MIVFHDPECVRYHRSGDPERPARITNTGPVLKERHPSWLWEKAEPAGDDELLRAHSAEHLKRVENPPGDFDVDSPAHDRIDAFARSAAGSALAAARAALNGEKAFSLMRPPGHHATRDRAMGFCYLSNVAVAALDALTAGAGKVAIWDFDAHHGNGTEDIVRDRKEIAFASIHQSPGYPGTGLHSFERVYNFPVPPYTARKAHMNAMEEALRKLTDFKPDLLLVSAGFDAYAQDPITQMTLEREDFATLGMWLADLQMPTAAILEGGYSDDLTELVDIFLTSWAKSQGKLTASPTKQRWIETDD